ncbi:YqjF family protein [Fulvivirga lutimaris]|uniref:YqjF family protein n=1 Tax=Fulvivirga lutimaris TaxID=1819566 RepID=UPI0012BCFADE|nr:DUF2071 domain-containing protein [Fulvivirga lutimaris]MTI41730.1 DUF2071 domain-containing protein [Fulvivirga lutimaris]
MRLNKLLSQVDHRPWPLPSGKWKFYQEWNKAVFLHWQVDSNMLRDLVPKELEIDLFEDKPWVSIVAFTMENVRPRVLPTFPPVSNFEEINIRTYVKNKGKTGVYFLSIEAGNKVSTWLAKSISELPYRFSKIKRHTNSFDSSNARFKDNLSINYNILEDKNDKTQLDKFLTERYALFQDSSSGINKFEIHHLEWPLHNIEINELTYCYPRFKSLFEGNPALVHYSSGVKVLAWGKEILLRK